jgi:hypothetical protein
MGGACIKLRGEEKIVHKFGSVDRRIILKWISGK